MKGLWLLCAVVYLFLFALLVFARPEYEFSGDGTHFRIFNPDKRAYYCIIQLGNDYPLEKIVYPGQRTRWYSMRGGYSTDCST